MSQKWLADEIEHVLAQDYQLLQQLGDILITEKEALTLRDNDALEKTHAIKVEVFTQLQNQETKRHALFSQAEIKDGNSKSLSDFIDTCGEPHKSKLQHTQKQLKAQLKICHDANILNGMLLNLTAYNNQLLLDIMHGKSLTTEEESYDKSGKVKRQAQSHGNDEA